MASSAIPEDELISITAHVAERKALTAPFPHEKERVAVKTSFGDLMVTVQGDLDKPTLITYHDVGLDHQSCFQGFFNYGPSHALASAICILHIDAPGQQEGAEQFPSTFKFPTFDELAEQIGDVLKHFKKTRFIGMGAGAGGNILLRYALAHPSEVTGLLLIGSNAQASGWAEWSYYKVALAHIYVNNAVTSFVQDMLLHQYFGPATIERNIDLVHAYKQHLSTRINPYNLSCFLSAFASRNSILDKITPDFSPSVLFAIGHQSHIAEDLENMLPHFNAERKAFLRVWGCSNMVHEERPDKMILPLLLFLQGLGLPCSTTAQLNTMSRTTFSSLQSASASHSTPVEETAEAIGYQKS